MLIIITHIGKTNPTDSSLPMFYYPRAIKSGEVDLEKLSEQIANGSSLTIVDCYAVIVSLVATFTSIKWWKIMRLGQLCAFQISVKGTVNPATQTLTSKSVTSASILFRPGKKFKAMLKNLTFIKK